MAPQHYHCQTRKNHSIIKSHPRSPKRSSQRVTKTTSIPPRRRSKTTRTTTKMKKKTTIIVNTMRIPTILSLRLSLHSRRPRETGSLKVIKGTHRRTDLSLHLKEIWTKKSSSKMSIKQGPHKMATRATTV